MKRRTFLVGSLLPLLASESAKAGRRLWGSGGGTSAATQLATHTLVNESGSTISAGSGSTSGRTITRSWGHVFKKGDIPSGTAPVYKDPATGLAQPYSWGLQAYHSDNSLMYAAFASRLAAGSSIPGSGSLGLGVWNGGSAPAGSGLTINDFYNELFKVIATGISGSGFGFSGGTSWGAWLSSLNAANISKNIITLDGPVGQRRSVWIEMSATEGGAAHGALVCQVDMFIALNDDGSKAFSEVLFDICQPYYQDSSHASGEASGTKVPRAFSALGWSVGGGATTPVPLPFNPLTIAYNGTDIDSGNSLFTSTAHGYYRGVSDNGTFQTQPCRISSAGTTTLSTTQIYYTISFGNNANQIELSQRSDGNRDGTTCAAGTFTLTPIYSVNPLCHMFGADASARYNFFQGSGSIASRPAIRTQYDKTYWRATRLIDDWDPTFTPASDIVGVAAALPWGATAGPSGAAVTWPNWYPGYLGPMQSNFTDTAERADLGLFTSWHAMHYYMQSAIDEYLVRSIGFVAGNWPKCWYDATTKTVPNLRNQNYSGMPTSGPGLSLTWDNWGSASGFTPPTIVTPFQYMANGAGGDVAHRPNCLFYNYLVFGEPHNLRMMLELANHVEAGPTGRNTTSMPTVIYGGYVYGQAYRDVAWATRAIVEAAAFIPSSWIEYQYYRDMITDQLALFASLLATEPLASNSYAQTNKMWTLINPTMNGEITQQAPWQLNYYISALVHGINLLEGTQAATYAATVVGWIKTWMIHKFGMSPGGGGYVFGCYQDKEFINQAGQNSGTNPITDDEYFGIDLGGAYGVSCTAGTPGVITVDINGVTGTPTLPSNGDIIMFVAGRVPTGLTSGTKYFLRDKAGTGPCTYHIATTAGGTALNLTNTASALQPWMHWTWPAPGFWGSIQNSEYGAESLSWAFRAKNAGVVTTELDSLISDLQARVNVDSGFNYQTIQYLKYKLAA